MMKPIVSVSVAVGFIFGAIFLAPFAYVLSSAAYHILQRGNFKYTALDGTVTIFAAATDPAIYWKNALGLLFAATLLDLTITGLIVVAMCALGNNRRGDSRRI